MITPGFFSYFNTHRALMTSQNALNVVNHNISNANTTGYSRQRAEITAYEPYPMPTIHGMTNGQMGQGSIMKSIERIRDGFIDAQYRLENSLLGFNSVSRDVLQQVEAIMAEPTTGGQRPTNASRARAPWCLAPRDVVATFGHESRARSSVTVS
mgnify:CR=1 FL=1